MARISLGLALAACGARDSRDDDRDAEARRAQAPVAALPPGARDVPRRHLVRDELALGPRDDPAPLRLVVRDSAAWRATWQRLAADTAATPPAVDFGREQVLVVVDRLRTYSGDDLGVAAAYTNGDSLVVVVSARTVGAGCALGDAMTRPRHVVAIPRSPHAVHWREVVGRAPACR